MALSQEVLDTIAFAEKMGFTKLHLQPAAVTKDRQKKVIELAGLSSALNRQNILGKTADELKPSANYYKQIAARTDKLKQQ